MFTTPLCEAVSQLIKILNRKVRKGSANLPAEVLRHAGRDRKKLIFSQLTFTFFAATLRSPRLNRVVTHPHVCITDRGGEISLKVIRFNKLPIDHRELSERKAHSIIYKMIP